MGPWKENKRKQRSDKERREKEERKKEKKKKHFKITFNHREHPQQESQKDVAKKYRNTI